MTTGNDSIYLFCSISDTNNSYIQIKIGLSDDLDENTTNIVILLLVTIMMTIHWCIFVR